VSSAASDQVDSAVYREEITFRFHRTKHQMVLETDLDLLGSISRLPLSLLVELFRLFRVRINLKLLFILRALSCGMGARGSVDVKSL
jgi:hypothetical protein